MTDIPPVARLCPTRPSTLAKEKTLDNTKDKLLNTVSAYQRKHYGHIRESKGSNIMDVEKEAIKSVKRKIARE